MTYVLVAIVAFFVGFMASTIFEGAGAPTGHRGAHPPRHG